MNAIKLREIIKKEQSLTEENEGLFKEVFGQKLEILCEDLDKTIAFLDKCTRDEFYWVSNAFEDVSDFFKSNKFIECLVRNQSRFPDIANDIQAEIDYAIRIISGGDNL